jgi:histidinol-phosphate aminotransferase
MSHFRKEIDAIAGYTPGFQPKEAGFVKLNTNENPYPPSPRAVEAMRAAVGDSLRKYPPPMADAFRNAAARVLGTTPQRILVGNGSDDVLNIALRSFCGEGDPVAWPTPTYSLYDFLAAIQGARPVRVPFPGDYSLPPDLAATGARLTLLANPNAPTGTMVSPQQVSELAGEMDGVLLVDEAYVDFADANCLELVERHGNVIVCRSLSKSYSLAGLRVGYAVAQEPLIEGMCKVKDSYNVDSVALAGATAAIEDQPWLRRNVERIKATRRRMSAALEEMGFRCMPSHANFVFARAPEGTAASDLYRLLFERKVLVRYFNLPRVSDGLRISVGSEQEVDALLAALEQILASVKPTGGTR